MHSVFVSSTFRDMHFERDVLNRSVNAKLNRLLTEHNQSLRLVDLRWGVDTSALSEEESTQRVLQVCFHAVDDCKPYILILLGDRYGYIPKDSNISVTHMEILRGALENTDPDHVFVYIRETDPDAIPAEQRPVYIEQQPQSCRLLADLKTELLQRMPQRCRHYRSHWSDEQQLLVSEDFEQLVLADLSQDLLTSLALKNYRSQLHKQLAENDEILRENLQYAYCNDETMAQVVQDFFAEPLPYGVIGAAGVGKSVFMSLLCAKLRQAGHDAYILFCGDNAFSSGVRNAAEAMLYALTVASGEDYDFETNAQADYEQLLQKLMQQRQRVTKKVCFLLDAVDKCEAGMVQFLLWCHRFLSEQVHLSFSSQETEQIMQEEHSFNLVSITYTQQELRSIANSLLKKYGKTVNADILDQLVNKVTTPLQLSVLLLRLIHLNFEDFSAIEKDGGGMDAINRYLQGLIEAASDNEFELLDNYFCSLMEDNRNPQFTLFLFGLLIFSDRGLRETDMQEIVAMTTTPWVELDYLTFLEQFSFFIRLRENGRLDISHDVIRRCFRGQLQEQAAFFYSVLAQHFFQPAKPTPDEVSAFFSAAWGGKQGRAVVEYVLKHNAAMSSLESADVLFGMQLRQVLAQLLMRDDGKFMLQCFGKCRNIEEICKLQSTISSALTRQNNYLTDEEIFKVVQLCLAMPEKLTILPAQIALIELHTCEKFLQRHQCSNADILQYIQNCRQRIMRRAGGDTAQQASDDPIAQKLAVLSDPDKDILTKALALEQLSELGRKMAINTKTAQQAHDLLLKLEKYLLETPELMTQELLQMSLANIYTSLGVWGKTCRQWEEALAWDEKSTAIYQKLYHDNPSQEILRKYRERVYNEANIVEAWAMAEKDNASLWERAQQEYAKCYQLDMQAIAHGVDERELLQCASTILSYGTALVNCGEKAAGVQKFLEGMRLIEELAGNNPRADLYLKMVLHQLECAYQLCLNGHYATALELSQTVEQCICYILRHGKEPEIQRIQQYVAAFNNRANEMHAKLSQARDIPAMLSLCQITDKLFCALLPLNIRQINLNIMTAKRNIGNFRLKTGDYAGAAQVYGELLELVQQKDLLAPDEHGNYDERASLYLSNVYVRRLFCLTQLRDDVQIKRMADEASDWAKYISDHCPALKGDFARILLVMSVELSKMELHTLGALFLMLAFHATQEEAYDIEKHADTLAIILQQLGGQPE